MTDPRVLLERYKPRLVYDSHEVYFADSAAIWTDSRTNVLKRATGTVVAKPPQLSLAFLSAYPATATDTIGDTTRDYAKNAAKLHQQPQYRDRVHAHARRDPQGRLWLQYWLFYYYNDYQLLGPLSGGNHEGDWELVQLRLGANEKPVQAVYSQHKLAESRPFSGTTPIVYVARGSHANYFSTGSHWTGNWFDQADGKGPQIAPALIVLEDDTPWANWPGFWGDTKTGILPFDSSSPVSPGVRPHWLDPSLLKTAAPKAAPAAPPPPRATVKRTAAGVVVHYDAPANATALAVAIRPKGSDEPAITRAIALDSRTGDLALDTDGRDYDVWTSVVDADGVPSEGARAR
ncbi:hypothetical protein [Solirubrobacter soli]|uniref:hypothetical protein n=1 Tax=Solirubrobacter soli TaxID=363832 RepID=UPI0004041B1B|nr:hypothetical protein [Solirubrobacter soli]